MASGGVGSGSILMDEAGFLALVRATEVALRCYIAALGVGWADIDDLAQEAYLELHRRPAACPPGVAPLAWLKGIARNLAREHFRRRQRGRRLFCGLESALDAASAPPEDDGAGADDALAALRGCLEELSPEQRAVVAAWSSGGSLPALGDEALRKRAARLRQVLRDCVDRRLGDSV